MIEYFKRLYPKGNKEFCQKVLANLKNEKKMFIITANPETFSYGEKDEIINKMLLDKNVTLTPDGIGVVKASKMLGVDVKERITGIDIATYLLDVCNTYGYKLSLLGAKEEVLKALKDVIKTNYPNIKLGTCLNGYTSNKDEFFKKIMKEDIDVCLVALGIPNQEKIIYQHLDKFKKGIFVGVGGSFDVLSGLKKRAPKIWQKLNLEWLYRIIKEPKRLKRFYENNIKFIFKVKKLKQK